MSRFGVRFLLLFCVACLGFALDAGAVPSVKRLGINSYNGTANTAMAKKTSSSKNSDWGIRSSSIRTTGLNKPKSTIAGNLMGTKSTALDASRLSVGKYLHAAGEKAGKIKPIGSSSPANTEINALSVEIENIKDQMDKYNEDVVNNYYTKTDIDDKDYVTQTQVQNIQNNYYTKDQVDTKITDEMTSDAMAESIATKVAEKLVTVSNWNNDKPANLPAVQQD